jgi:hypothetical protein
VDIRNIAQMEGIFVQGRWLSAAALDAMLGETSQFMRELSAEMAKTASASAPGSAPR